MKKFEKNASLRKFAEVMQGDIDLESEEEYYSQEFCRVHFTNRTQKIGSTYNSASAAFLKVAESDEDKFYDPKLRKLTKTQRFDYFKPYCPITLNLSFDLSNINSCTCEFEYLSARELSSIRKSVMPYAPIKTRRIFMKRQIRLFVSSVTTEKQAISKLQS